MVERGDFMQIKPLGKGDDAGIDRLEPQRGIGSPPASCVTAREFRKGVWGPLLPIER